MGHLSYSAIASLDGYVVDAEGSFAWAFPTEEVHAAANDLLRGIDTQVYGRRTWEVMTFWDTAPEAELGEVEADFARLWRATDKVVVSTTLTEVSAPRTTLVAELDLADLARRRSAGEVSIGGPTLAGHALRAGLVDDVHLLLVPHVVGGGVRALPEGWRSALDLVAHRTFADGTVQLHHRPRG